MRINSFAESDCYLVIGNSTLTTIVLTHGYVHREEESVYLIHCYKEVENSKENQSITIKSETDTCIVLKLINYFIIYKNQV